MKRLPELLAFVLFLGLCASLTYWILHVVTPPPRAVTAPPRAVQAAPSLSAVAGLFGGQGSTNGMTKVQLRGVIMAGRPSESVAILVPEGAAAVSLRVKGEVTPGVTVKEIHSRHVVLSDHGVDRELSLPSFASAGGATNTFLPPVPARTMPEPALNPPALQTPSQAASQSVPTPSGVQSGASMPTATSQGNGSRDKPSPGVPPVGNVRH